MKTSLRNLEYLSTAGISILKSLQISQHLLNNLKVKIMARKYKYGKAPILMLDCMISQVSLGL